MLFAKLWARNFRKPSGIFGKFLARRMNRGNGSLHRHLMLLMKQKAGIRLEKGRKVLDIGFSNGRFIPDILDEIGENGYLSGIDISPSMLKSASAFLAPQIEAGRMELKLCKPDSIPFPDQEFELVVSENSIYYWEDQIAYMKEMRRVLIDGGKAWIAFHEKRKFEETEWMSDIIKLNTVEDVLEKMKKAGFSSIHWYSDPNGSKWDVIVEGTRKNDKKALINDIF